MAKGLAEWQDLLKGAILPPVLAFGGEEHALVSDAMRNIRTRVLSGGLADFNHDKLTAKDGIHRILERANSLPIMAKLRLVEVHEAEKLTEEDLATLKSYIKDPSNTSVVIFIFGQLDLRQKLIKLLDQEAYLVKFEHPKEHQMPRFIRDRGQIFNLKITPDAANLLAILVGTDLLMLERALEKLKIICEHEVTAAHVQAQVASTRLEDAFLLGKAILAGDRSDAFKRLYWLKEEREVPLRLVGLLAWQLRQVMRARQLFDDGVPEYEIGKKLSLFGDRLSPVMKSARNMNLETHVTRLLMLKELDRKLKSSRAAPWLWLERAILQLCPSRGR